MDQKLENIALQAVTELQSKSTIMFIQSLMKERDELEKKLNLIKDLLNEYGVKKALPLSNTIEVEKKLNAVDSIEVWQSQKEDWKVKGEGRKLHFVPIEDVVQKETLTEKVPDSTLSEQNRVTKEQFDDRGSNIDKILKKGENKKEESIPSAYQAFKGFKQSDEKDCIDRYIKLRWPDRITCPSCGCKEIHVLSGGNYKCLKKTCAIVFNYKTGTIFDASRISFDKWFSAIQLVIDKQGNIGGKELSELIDVNIATADKMLFKLLQFQYIGVNLNQFLRKTFE
jgi:hypothetical protein